VDDYRKLSNGFLLDYHYHDGMRGQSLDVLVKERTIKVSGWVQDPGSIIGGDCDVNEFDWADVEIPADELAEALCAAQLGKSWSRSPVKILGQTLTCGNNVIRYSSSSPGDATASLGEQRFNLLLLDASDVAFEQAKEARTGTMLPRDSLDAAFLAALRRRPEMITQLRAIGIERSVLALLNEASQDPVALDPILPDSGLWLARSKSDDRASMLVAVDTNPAGQMGLHLVDRINGIRDRNMSPKAVIVTRSHFSADVTEQYGALSHRMELVDFDRLSGMLRDAGWTSESPGFLISPVKAKPRHKVFISYSWRQHDFAVWLYNRFHGWSYSCFLDRVDLNPGDVILSAVKEALDGTDAVLLCCSQDSLKSKWVAAEIDYCLEHEKATGRTILIPILVDNTRFPQPLASLRERLAADCRSWRSDAGSGEALGKIRAAVDKTIAQKAAAESRKSVIPP
jgi:hypothetical protein